MAEENNPQNNNNNNRKLSEDELPFDPEEIQENVEATGETLAYNEEQDSFELDADAGDTDYDHPLPYDTAAPEGQDDSSLYDESNPYAQSEYQDKQNTLEGELQELDDIVTTDDIKVDPIDEEISMQPKDFEDNLDEEGYPKREDADGDDNPITHLED